MTCCGYAKRLLRGLREAGQDDQLDLGLLHFDDKQEMAQKTFESTYNATEFNPEAETRSSSRERAGFRSHKAHRFVQSGRKQTPTSRSFHSSPKNVI
mmetsp:Transcript_73993/g.206668  ORF Transcript_73993/g.206668 Transcript_73993/m.206668 type:complete len:97 (-) Transcript_73993:44-334(-)